MSYYKLLPGTSVQAVINAWVKRGEKAYDESMPVRYSASDVWPYREFTRTRDGIKKGDPYAKNTPKQWDELVDRLVGEGWSERNPLMLWVGRNGVAYVGEGNHRLAIAREYGLSVPVRFVFVQEAEHMRAGARERKPNPSKPGRVTLATAKRIGARLKVNWAKVDLKEFRRGLEVEQEHWRTLVAAGGKQSLTAVGRIALDHLKELPDYYTRLDRMERR